LWLKNQTIGIDVTRGNITQRMVLKSAKLAAFHTLKLSDRKLSSHTLQSKFFLQKNMSVPT